MLSSAVDSVLQSYVCKRLVCWQLAAADGTARAQLSVHMLVPHRKLIHLFFSETLLKSAMHMDNIQPTLQGNQITVGLANGQRRAIVVCQCSKVILISALGLLVVFAIILIAALILRNM